MIHLISLDKKLNTVAIRLTKEEFSGACTQHNITPEQLQQDIQRQLYGKFIEQIARTIPTKVDSNEKEQKFNVSGYVFNESEMIGLIKEILEIDDEKSKTQYLNEINIKLGIYA